MISVAWDPEVCWVSEQVLLVVYAMELTVNRK